MAYINASTQKNRVKLLVAVYDETAHASLSTSDFYSAVDATTGAITKVSGVLEVPGLQDITIGNSNGSFRWKQLDQSGENVITTNATNTLSGNFVLDPTTFFGTGSGTTAAGVGVFGLSNARTQVVFMVAPSGATAGNAVLMGTGFISALAPTTSADSPIFVSPITIEVNGDYTKATTA